MSGKAVLEEFADAWPDEHVVKGETGKFPAEQVDALGYLQGAVCNYAGFIPVLAQAATAIQYFVANFHGEVRRQGLQFLQNGYLVHLTKIIKSAVCARVYYYYSMDCFPSEITM